MQSLACVVVKKLHDCGFRVVRIRVDGFCRVGGGGEGFSSATAFGASRIKALALECKAQRVLGLGVQGLGFKV